uniref:Uncharacterized protein n=1 Tax=Opuntia streptacantha TaxID=393608 RepID=A0A7C8Z7Z8_OPUST
MIHHVGNLGWWNYHGLQHTWLISGWPGSGLLPPTHSQKKKTKKEKEKKDRRLLSCTSLPMLTEQFLAGSKDLDSNIMQHYSWAGPISHCRFKYLSTISHSSI